MSYFPQSGRPTASGGRFCAVVVELGEPEALPVEFDDMVPVLLPLVPAVLPVFEAEPLLGFAVLLGLMLLPLLVPLPVWFVSLRTWLAAASQHFCVLPEDIVLGELVDEDEVWAAATPEKPAKIAAAAINCVLPI